METTEKPKKQRKPVPRTAHIEGATRYLIHPDGSITRRGKLVATHAAANGSLKVNLLTDKGYRSTFVVARIVGKAFCPDFKPWLRPVYRNGNRNDCRPSNLKWVPVADVMAPTGGGRRRSCKLTEEQVATIRRSSLGAEVCAKLYGVSVGHIYDIRAGRAWSCTINRKGARDEQAA